jgi:magnesium transporter
VIAHVATRATSDHGDGLRVLSGEDLRHQKRALEEASLAWIDVNEPDQEDIDWLAERFKLHPLVVQDIRSRHQRPKLEHYEGAYFGVLYAMGSEPKGQRRRLQMHELHIFWTAQELVTIHWSAIPALDELTERVRNRTLMPAVAGAQRPLEIADIAYALLDTVIDGYFPAIDLLAEWSEDIEEEMFSQRRSEATLESIFQLKKDLFQMRKFVAPARDVMNILLRREHELFADDFVPYVQDLYDHVNRVTDSLDTYRDLLSSAMDTYLSFISNDVNQTVKKMTAVTAILMVDALIAGIYGMNFHYMPELEWQYGYPFAIGLMLAATAGLWLIFRRLQWF